MNKWIKGLGYWCPDCGGDGYTAVEGMVEYGGGRRFGFPVFCETCGGDGRVEATVAEILSGDVPEYPAPENYSIARPVTVELASV